MSNDRYQEIRKELAQIVRRDEGEPVWIEPNEAAAILRALAQQPAAVDGAYPTPRNRVEAVALARLAQPQGGGEAKWCGIHQHYKPCEHTTPPSAPVGVTPECLSALRSYQQADAEGVMVTVSRQALDEVIAALAQQPAARRQYFYKVNDCPADGPREPDCICWHDEGTGPLADGSAKAWRDVLAQQPAACPKCDGTGEADSGGIMPWGAPATIPCDCQQPTAVDGAMVRHGLCDCPNGRAEHAVWCAAQPGGSDNDR